MPIINSKLKDFLVAENDIKIYALGQKDEGMFLGKDVKHWVLFGGYTFEEFLDFPYEHEEKISVINSNDGSNYSMGFRLSTTPDEDCLYECKANTFWAGMYKKEEDVLLEGIIPKGTQYFISDDGKMITAKKFIILREVYHHD